MDNINYERFTKYNKFYPKYSSIKNGKLFIVF